MTFDSTVDILNPIEILLRHNSVSVSLSLRCLLVMLLVTPSISNIPQTSLLLTAFHSNIISGIMLPVIVFKYPNHLQWFFFYCLNKVFCWIFIIYLFFMSVVFSFLDVLPSITVANNLFTWYLYNVQVLAPYNMTICCNDLKINVFILFTFCSMKLDLACQLFFFIHVFSVSQYLFPSDSKTDTKYFN